MASSSASFLSNSHYGYDFVVATTQDSINGTMKMYLDSFQEPIVNVCFVADDSGNPVYIEYEDLMKRCRNIDPFSIPADADPTNNGHLTTLATEARFMGGFRAQLGIPPMDDPLKIPDVVTLGANTASVGFNMLCSQFTVVAYTPGGGWSSKPQWYRQDQQSNDPWIFQSRVDMRLHPVNPKDYAKLDKKVQARSNALKNLGADAFSIQQLLFDLTSSTLMSIPTIPGVQPGDKLYTFLHSGFMDAYFAKMQTQNTPLLGVSIVMTDTVDDATLKLTDFAFEVSPYVDSAGTPIANVSPIQQQAATLNYLCAADGNKLPAAVPLTWNWVTADPAIMRNRQGVIAINRNAFMGHFRQNLDAYASLHSVSVSVDVPSPGTSYYATLTPGQQPDVTFPTTGPSVLHYHYRNEDSGSAGGPLGGALDIIYTFDMDISFKGTTITVSQAQTVFVSAMSGGIRRSGNIVEKTLTDTCSIGIDDNGRLNTTITSVPTDNSYLPSEAKGLDVFNHLNAVLDHVYENAHDVTDHGAVLSSLPLNVVEDYIFPGGQTFTYQDVAFSDNQDLVASIRYADVTQVTPSVSPPQLFGSSSSTSKVTTLAKTIQGNLKGSHVKFGTRGN